MLHLRLFLFLMSKDLKVVKFTMKDIIRTLKPVYYLCIDMNNCSCCLFPGLYEVTRSGKWEVIKYNQCKRWVIYWI